MSRESVVVLGWGGLLAGLAAGLLAFTTDWLQLLLFFGAAGVTLALGAVLWRARGKETRRIPDSSYATIAVALGASAAALGAAFGIWLVLIGAGIAALGLAGVARELWAERRRR